MRTLLPVRRTGPPAFALVSVLAILALILVAVVSLSSVLHVETRSSATLKDLTLARQNALLGLETALGQLQQYAGKDQAVTFPATTYYPAKGDPKNPASDTLFKFYKDNAVAGTQPFGPRRTYLTNAGRQNFENALRNWWNNNRNPRWVGVADASLRRDNISSDKFGEPKRDQLPAWLVSGNEKFTITGSTSSYPSGYFTPDTQLPDPPFDPNDPSASPDARKVVWLVGNGSATLAANSTDGLSGWVKARKQEIYAQSGSSTQTIGHYAYWVGDESTKANFAVRDTTSANDASYPNDVPLTSSTYRSRLQVPQRIGWENISGFSGNATFPANDPKLQEISTSREISLLEPDTARIQTIYQAAKRSFHSLTAFSQSLLTDTALGGLKKDLTVFFEGSGSGINLSAPVVDRSLYDPADPRFGSSNAGFPATAAAAGLPTWQQIKDWYDNNQGEMAPVLSHFQFFCALTHRNGQIQFHILPIIFLWNPYDAPLASKTYILEFRHNIGFWRFGVATNGGSDPNPANPADGEMVGTGFVSPLAAQGWYANTNKFGCNPLSGMPFNVSEGRPTYRFAPFDVGSALPRPDQSGATYVPYRITSGFAPGEVKVFSLTGEPVEFNPADLHNKAVEVPLVNDYEPDFPGSYYFTIASGLTRDGLNPPGPGDDVRWYAEVLNSNNPSTFSARLRVGATQIWETLFTDMGAQSRWLVSSPWDPDTRVANNTTTWAKLYHFDTWKTLAKSVSDTRLRTSPIQAFAYNRMVVFPVRGWELFNTTQGIFHGGVHKFLRLFANYNPAASVLDPVAEIDLSRSRDAVNNQDNFVTFTWWNQAPNWNPVLWDDNQVSGSNGFALFTWKASDTDLNNKGLSRIRLRLPRGVYQLASIGQLQQANLSRYFWQPAFPLGNSEASGYVDRERAAGLQSYQVRNASSTSFMLLDLGVRAASSPRAFPNDNRNRFLDLSYVLNENFWDRYFLSTIPQSGALNVSSPLRNSRHRYAESAAAAATSELRGFDTAAAHLRNAGALNVNSTSVEAWKALLTAFRNLAIATSSGQNPDKTLPISRNLEPNLGPVRFSTSAAADPARVPADYGANSSGLRDYSRMFEGFRYLTDTQIQRLAERIVDEVRLRGPFYSLADFVNRRLVAPDRSTNDWLTARTANQNSSVINNTHAIGAGYDPFVGLFGINGALQRAINLSGINGGMNYPYAEDTSDRAFRVDGDLSNGVQGDPMMKIAAAATYLDTEHLSGAPAGEMGQLLSHAPGFVTQGDLLAMIGPALTPRGDTFLIRTYGDVTDRSGRVVARAWLEAVVQREIEPVKPAGTSGADKYRPANKFGRKFKVVNLRWLNPDEV